MKYWHCCIKLGFIVLFLNGLAPGKSLAALPLQVGVYRLGSRYIQIAEKQNRICFKNSSSYGATVASVSADTNRQDFYQINGVDGAFLLQQDQETLLFGPIHQLVNYAAEYNFPRELDDDLQQCLSSQKPFFKRNLPPVR
jgi:hypothetical protein